MQLLPFDVALALRLIKPAGTLAELARELGVQASQVHQSLRRLDAAGLVLPGSRNANRAALREFVEHGVRYAFPARPGSGTVGIPTAHSGPDLSDRISAADAYVWPAAGVRGAIRGVAVEPLYKGAPLLKETSPETYRLLTLVDVFRVGRSRERALAAKHFHEALKGDPA